MEKLYAYTMRSRSKDNKDIAGFKSRIKVYLCYESEEAKMIEKFDRFVSDGVRGEKSRLYKSVNARNEEKTKKAFLARAIAEDIPVVKYYRVLVGISMLVENRAESKWLFDFDSSDEEMLSKFVDRTTYYGNFNKCDIFVQQTPHGFAVVVSHGFDTRKLMEEFADCNITLKRDDALFVKMVENSSK